MRIVQSFANTRLGSLTMVRRSLRPLLWSARFLAHLRFALFRPSKFGHCPLCEGRTLFVRVGPRHPDDLRCVRCFSVPRWRALMIVLDRLMPEWRSRRIYESGPGGAASAKLERECTGYSASHYLPSIPFGTADARGVRSETLVSLTYPDESFDLVVTQDVFEHVVEPERGFAEIARVLRAHGAHIFTVPYHHDQEGSARRATLGEGGEVVHLLPPEFHRDPTTADGALVVTDWGRDLPEHILRASGMTTTTHVVHDPRQGVGDPPIHVFVSTKSSGSAGRASAPIT